MIRYFVERVLGYPHLVEGQEVFPYDVIKDHLPPTERFFWEDCVGGETRNTYLFGRIKNYIQIPNADPEVYLSYGVIPRICCREEVVPISTSSTPLDVMEEEMGLMEEEDVPPPMIEGGDFVVRITAVQEVSDLGRFRSVELMLEHIRGDIGVSYDMNQAAEITVTLAPSSMSKEGVIAPPSKRVEIYVMDLLPEKRRQFLEAHGCWEVDIEDPSTFPNAWDRYPITSFDPYYYDESDLDHPCGDCTQFLFCEKNIYDCEFSDTEGVRKRGK